MQQTLKHLFLVIKPIPGSMLPIQRKLYVGLSWVELTLCADTWNPCDSLPLSVSHSKENGFEKQIERGGGWHSQQCVAPKNCRVHKWQTQKTKYYYILEMIKNTSFKLYNEKERTALQRLLQHWQMEATTRCQKQWVKGEPNLVTADTLLTSSTLLEMVLTWLWGSTEDRQMRVHASRCHKVSHSL